MKKIVFLIAIIAIASCADGPLFDITKFLDVSTTNEGAKIETEICMDETIFKIGRISIKPEEIIKGQDINFKAQGTALKDIIIKNLHLITKYNDEVIFEDNKDQGSKAVAEGGKFVFSYVASVPSFTPSGSWDIYLYLQNENDEDISCLKAHFDMP